MDEGPLYVKFPAEAAIPAQPHHEAFHLPFFPRSAHVRHLIGLGLATAGSVGLLAAVLYPLVTHSAVAMAVFVHPAQIAQTMQAAPKGNRIETKRHFDGSRFAQVAEKLSSGETRIFTYHRLTVVFNDEAEPREQVTTAAYVDDSEPGSDISAIMPAVATYTGAAPLSSQFASQRRSRFPTRSVALNVSVATPGPAAPARNFERLVSMPKSKQELADILETAGVSTEHREELVKALATDTVAPGDNLELLMQKNSKGQPQLVMAKLSSDNGQERVVARDDANGFVPLSDDRLFSTLYSENQPDAPSSSEVAAVDLKDLDESDETTVRSRLAKAGLSSDAAEHLIKLAKAKNIPLVGTDGAPDSVDLLFRKSDDSTSELMFIEFHSGDEAHRFYLHKDGSDNSEYYDEDGRSVSKVLAHKPVPNGKLGDGFAWRIHPILGVKKFHNGVDYRAPMGSPIQAAGDGTVELISSEVGYGKYVRIRHDSGYETTYAHIASTVNGLKVGQRVKQGQVIAYVGSTGYSTGPHLYYELRVNGRYENPLTAQLPAGTVLTGKSLDNLRSQVDHVDSIMSYLDIPPPEPTRTEPAIGRPFPEFGERPGHFGRQ